MQWSKLKKLIEQTLAASVKPHLQIHVTRYGPGDSYYMARAWVTWDKEEVASFSTAKWAQECYETAQEIREINSCEDYRDPDQRKGYYTALAEAERIMDEKGLFSRSDFYDSLMAYLELSVEEAIQADDAIIRAFAMLDKRLGKRRLRAMDEPRHPLVKMFYRLRCEAEGIDPSQGRTG